MSRVRVVHDTFTEASDTAIASHTPDVGTGYVLLAGSGAITVWAAQDVAIDSNFGSGNRAIEQTVIATKDQDVECTLKRLLSDNCFPGVFARYTASGYDRCEATFDSGTGTYGSYSIEDAGASTTNSYALTSGEAWAINESRRFRLEIRGTVSQLFVDGVLKVTHTAPNNAFSTKAGFLIGNFAGVGSVFSAEDFEIYAVDPINVWQLVPTQRRGARR